MPRLRKPPEKKIELMPPNDVPDEHIQIALDDDDAGQPTQIDLESREEPTPVTKTPPTETETEDDPVKRALEATQRAEDLQRQLAEQQRQAEELRRQARDRDEELNRQRADAEDAQYNSVLTAIAAEQSALEKAEIDYATAMQAQDYATAAKAQTVMARASGRIDRLEENRQIFEVRREEVKRAPPPRQNPSFEERIAQLPDEAKQWLRQHPEFINDSAKNQQIGVVHNYIVRKHPQFSKEYFEALDSEFGFRAEPAAQKTEQPAPAMAPARRSIPVSAPVSRDAPSMSGGPKSGKRVVDLSPDERAVARASFTAEDMTNEQKERLYAINKEKLLKMRANGQYRHTTEQTG